MGKMGRRKFNWKVFVIVIACILAVYLIIALLPRHQSREDNPFVVEGKPLLIAHGGGNREFPDNTLEACYNAYGVDSQVMLEMDVSITKDGVVIMSHDTTLDYRTNASGAIADWNYTDLLEQRVDFSYLNKIENGKVVQQIKYTDYQGREVTPLDVQYPDGVTPRDDSVFLVTRLEDVLQAFPDNTVNVEIKQEGETGIRALHAVAELIEKYDAYDRVVLASFHNEIYKEIKKLYKQTPQLMFSPEYVGVGMLYLSGALKLDALYGQPVTVLQIPVSQKVGPITINLDKKWFVETAHKHNIAVHFWTIDNENEMRRLAELGADGIMTNLPHTLKAVYDDMYPQG